VLSNQKPIRRRPMKKAMAEQAQQRSPPHILADEHFKEAFNPPEFMADYRVPDAFLRRLSIIMRIAKC
jgi:hypothetical protein